MSLARVACGHRKQRSCLIIKRRCALKLRKVKFFRGISIQEGGVQGRARAAHLLSETFSCLTLTFFSPGALFLGISHILLGRSLSRSLHLPPQARLLKGSLWQTSDPVGPAAEPRASAGGAGAVCGKRTGPHLRREGGHSPPWEGWEWDGAARRRRGRWARGYGNSYFCMLCSSEARLCRQVVILKEKKRMLQIGEPYQNS